MSAAPIRVLVADDHTIVRKGICALLGTEPDIEVVGEASDGAEAVELARACHPDVVLMDLVMPGTDGVQATADIVRLCPDTAVLVLTSFSADEKVISAIRAGAMGFHFKDADPADVVQAIRRVHAGQASLDPMVTRKLMSQMSRPAPEATIEELTPREVDVVQLIARGLSNQQIGDELCISEVTVRTHVSNVLGKLNLSSRTQVALWALRHGVATLED